MYHKFRITVAAIVVMVLCMLSSTMTLSYFTDSKVSTNEFTVGNASTALAVYGKNNQAFDATNYSPLVDMDIPFYLQATNDGNIPVYQRFRVVIPTALANVITLSLPTDANYTVTTATSANNGAYFVYYITSTNPLDVNATTAAWPTEAKISINDIDDVDITEFTCSDQSSNDCKLWINVYSDAVQTTGFTDAAAAFAGFTETYNN